MYHAVVFVRREGPEVLADSLHVLNLDSTCDLATDDPPKKRPQNNLNLTFWK